MLSSSRTTGLSYLVSCQLTTQLGHPQCFPTWGAQHCCLSELEKHQSWSPQRPSCVQVPCGAYCAGWLWHSAALVLEALLEGACSVCDHDRREDNESRETIFSWKKLSVDTHKVSLSFLSLQVSPCMLTGQWRAWSTALPCSVHRPHPPRGCQSQRGEGKLPSHGQCTEWGLVWGCLGRG